MKFTCQCCGYKSLSQQNNYEICKICFWEDDPSQSKFAKMSGGANNLSLIDAQQNYIKYKVSDSRYKDKVRSITNADEKDLNWVKYE